MHLLRATFSSPMINQPESLVERMVFIWIVFSFVLINPFIQSKLNSLLTVSSTYYDNIQAAEDLIRLNYIIYSTKMYFSHYNASINQNFITVESLQHCLNKLLQDENVASINDCQDLKYSAVEDTKLHISEDMHLTRYFVAIFRNDFPLIKRVRIIYNKILEHVLINHLRSLNSFRQKRSPDIFLNERKPTSLQQIQFIFNFGKISYLFCFAVLIIEIIFK